MLDLDVRFNDMNRSFTSKVQQKDENDRVVNESIVTLQKRVNTSSKRFPRAAGPPELINTELTKLPAAAQ